RLPVVADRVVDAQQRIARRDQVAEPLRAIDPIAAEANRNSRTLIDLDFVDGDAAGEGRLGDLFVARLLSGSLIVSCAFAELGRRLVCLCGARSDREHTAK